MLRRGNNLSQSQTREHFQAPSKSSKEDNFRWWAHGWTFINYKYLEMELLRMWLWQRKGLSKVGTLGIWEDEQTQHGVLFCRALSIASCHDLYETQQVGQDSVLLGRSWVLSKVDRCEYLVSLDVKFRLKNAQNRNAKDLGSFLLLWVTRLWASSFIQRYPWGCTVCGGCTLRWGRGRKVSFPLSPQEVPA